MRYIGALLASALLCLALFAGLKVLLVHRLAVPTMGWRGAVETWPMDILWVGSSHTRQSYNVRLLDHQTDEGCYLLAYSGLDPVNIEVLLSHYFKTRQQKPKLLVLESYSAMISRRPDLSDTALFFDAPPRVKLALISAYVQSHPGAHGWKDVFSLVVNRDNELWLTYPINSRLLRGRYFKGMPIAKELVGVNSESFRKFDLRIDPEPRPEQTRAIINLIQLARANAVPLVFVETPMPSSVERSEVVARNKKTLRELITSNGARYIDGAVGFPCDGPENFSDSNHLSAKGRDLFTTRIVAELRSLGLLVPHE